MFKNIKSYVLPLNFAHYLKPILEAPEETYPLDYADIAQYADCPARWHASQSTLEDELNTFDHIVAIAATSAPAFDKTYAVPPATLSTPTLVCPRCGSTSTAKLCTKCNAVRAWQNLALPYSPTSKAGKAWKDTAAKSGRFPLPPVRATKAIGAANALKADAAIASLAQSCPSRLALDADWVSDLATTPVPVRAVIDLLPEQWEQGETGIIAIIACTTAHPVPFAIHAYRRALHIRAALELDLCAAADLGPRSKYLLAAVEAEPPHVVARRMLSPDAIAAGRQVYQQALDNYALSRAKGYWPDYDTLKQNFPAWSIVDPEGALHNQSLALAGPLPGLEPAEPASPVGLAPTP